jgi:transcriptional regulator with XRE-family HTH domain
MHGYTVSLVRVNRAAPSHMLGVKLGRACIKAGISVAQVAADFDVSRTAVYAWFCGRSSPNWRLESAIEKYIKELA